jgi:hypothetical protein
MLKIFAFLTKSQDVATRAFIDHYETKHVPFIRASAPVPIVYKRNYLVRGDELNHESDAIAFDVVTELVFPDRAGYLAWRAALSTPSVGAEVVADESRFLDRARTCAYVIDERVSSPVGKSSPRS